MTISRERLMEQYNEFLRGLRVGLTTSVTEGYRGSMEVKAPPTTPQPPYQFPRQKPTDESVDCDGDILICTEHDMSWWFSWKKPSQLCSEDVWVPGCSKFFEDWADAPPNWRPTEKFTWADAHCAMAAKALVNGER